jgi:hypothetical protein
LIKEAVLLKRKERKESFWQKEFFECETNKQANKRRKEKDPVAITDCKGEPTNVCIHEEINSRKKNNEFSKTQNSEH